MPLRQPKRMQKEENLYTSEEDRIHLESLPETVRERILYERHLKKTEDNEKRELKHRNSRLIEEETESESEEDIVQKRDKIRSLKQSRPVSFDMFKCTVLCRNTFVSNMYKRTFKLLNGYYVKIRLEDGYHIYRISKIYEGKRYEIDGKVTNYWMHLERAGDKKEVNIQSISNKAITKSEYSKYIKENIVPGGDKSLQQMHNKLIKSLESRMSEAEQDYSLGQMRRFSKDQRIAAKRRVELKVRLEKAKSENNLEEVDEIEKELHELAEPSEACGA
ncbi:hypothetical protein NEIRO03_0658 [Nematocida sp. AWRm78]|nr:hypothetical protein NEIRO03_0658 [Nematocida sp. AWRm78]